METADVHLKKDGCERHLLGRRIVCGPHSHYLVSCEPATDQSQWGSVIAIGAVKIDFFVKAGKAAANSYDVTCELHLETSRTNQDAL